MSQKFFYMGADGLTYESQAYESTDYAATGGAGSENKPLLLNGSGVIPSSMIDSSAIEHHDLNGLGDDDHTQYSLSDGSRNYSAKVSYSSHPSFSADTELVDKKYVDDEIDSHVAGLLDYKGVFDADTPSPDFDAQDNFKGDFYKVSVAGTYLGYELNVGDSIYFNKDVLTAATPSAADIDVIDNTEASDILREQDLSDGQIFVGDATNIAQAVTMSGDVTLSNTGVAAIGSEVIVNADISTSAAIALSKLASGTDGQIIVCNGSGVPTYVTSSGDVTVDNAGAFTIGADKVKDSMIDWGTGAGQVSAGDLPILDSGAYTDQTEVEGALQELYGLIGEDGVNYEAGTGGVTKGDPVYISGTSVVSGASGKVSSYTTISVSQRVIGIALSTVAAGSLVKVLANDTIVSGLTFGGSASAGDPVYWDGSQHTATIPATAGQFIWQTGVVGNSGVMHVENRFVKKNA
jgi:hypothetical protein